MRDDDDTATAVETPRAGGERVARRQVGAGQRARWCGTPFDARSGAPPRRRSSSIPPRWCCANRRSTTCSSSSPVAPRSTATTKKEATNDGSHHRRAGRGGARQPRSRGRRCAHDDVAQHPEHQAQPAAAGVRHHPAGHLRADVPLRVRRRHPGQPAAGSDVRELPDAGDLRADDRVRLAHHRRRPRRRPQQGPHRPLPLAADGPFRGAGRAHARRPAAQLLRGDPDVHRRVHRGLDASAPTCGA